MKKNRNVFLTRDLQWCDLKGVRVPTPPPPFFHFPTAASLTRVIVECTSLVGEYKPAYAALAVKYFSTLGEKVRIPAQALISFICFVSNCQLAQASLQFLRPPFGTLWNRPSTGCVCVNKCRHDGILKTFFLLYYIYIYLSDTILAKITSTSLSNVDNSIIDSDNSLVTTTGSAC